MVDHVHMLLSIPPQYAVSEVVGYIEGKSAIHLARTYGERKLNFAGRHFWARGYFVSIYIRTNRWSKSGVLDQIFELLQGEQIVRIKIEAVKMDSTIVKAHPYGAGALKNGPQAIGKSRGG